MTTFFDVHKEPHEKPEAAPIHWRPSGYTCIAEDRKLLLIRPSWHTQWELPGGGVNLDELLIEGAIRETREETGYTVTIDSPEPFFVDNTRFYINLITKDMYCNSIKCYFVAKRTDAEQQPFHIGSHGIVETEGLEWIPFEKLTPERVHHASWRAVTQFLALQ